HAAIEMYASKNNTVLILGDTSKNSDSSGYRWHISYVKNRANIVEKKRNTLPSEPVVFLLLVLIIENDQKNLQLQIHHNPDIYNAISHQCQYKLQSLNEIEVLLKTLQDDKNILCSIATKTAHNNECDQDSEFIQAIFWSYCYAFSQFAVAKNELALITACFSVFSCAKHQLCIWHVFKNIQNKLKKDIKIDEIVKTIWLNAKSYMNETWMQHKESWLAPYINNNISLNIRLFQWVESLYSKLKGVENHIIPVNRLLSIIWQQQQEHSQKLAYEIFLYQNRQMQDKTDISLEKSFLIQQEDLAVSGTYEVLAYKEHVMDPVPFQFVQAFNKLPKYHHGTFVDLMQKKNGIMLELTTKTIIEQQAKFKTINIDNTMNYNNLIILEVKYSHKSGTSQEYWFYAPECAQLASDTYNVPVIVFGANSNTSLLFLLFEQKPGLRRKPIVLHWDENDHIVLIKIKPNKSMQVLPLNPQYTPISNHLNFSTNWFDLFI
ncbi:7409_t:CDS:2, partial [Gigaspora margarita]